MEFFILLFLIFLNALFVMSEIALVSARKARLEARAQKGDEKSKAALDLAANPEKFLSTAQIGITLISILTGVYSGEKFGDRLSPILAEKFQLAPETADTIATTAVVIIVTFVSIILGELIPKKLGLIQAEKIARLVAGPMNAISILVYPFGWLLNTVTNLIFKLFNIRKPADSAVTEEEIKAMITEGSDAGSIEEDEKDIIERVFHLGDRNITSLMTHRTDLEWRDVTETVGDFKSNNEKIVYSSFPVCEETVDNIKGIIYVKDLVNAPDNMRLDQLMKSGLFVPENNSAYQVLEKFKSTKIHTAFIVNEYGTLEGMITLNDILEAIIGEVPQTDQDEYEIIKRDDGTYLVDAQIGFYDFLSYYDRADWIDQDEHAFDTLAGFTLHELEHIPHTGETFEWRDFRFEILDMDGQRIDKILVTCSEELKTEIEEESN